MVTRILLARAGGAGIRAGLMALLVATPQLMLGGSEAGGQVVALFALVVALFTASEYVTASPSLVEFRDAPPYNRIRAGALGLGILTVSLILQPTHGEGLGDLVVHALAGRAGDLLDRPYSPVHLVMLALPRGAALAPALRDAAALAYLLSLLMVATFALLVRLDGWPSTRRFNVWVNLPQFDPTAGGDVVERLQNEANLNLSLGVVLPFLVPAVGGFLLDPLGGPMLAQPVALTWLVAAWAFFPAGLIMRGIALHRVAAMIAAQRRRAARAAEAGATLQPA